MSILKDVLKSSLETFLETLNKPVDVKNQGICHNYDSGDSWHKKLLIECCKELNCFSGSAMYPIGDDLDDAANKYHYIENLWDKRTNYGKLRHSVLNLMRDKVSQELSIRNSGVK